MGLSFQKISIFRHHFNPMARNWLLSKVLCQAERLGPHGHTVRSVYLWVLQIIINCNKSMLKSHMFMVDNFIDTQTDRTI